MSRFAILTYHSVDPSGSVLSVDPQTFAQQMQCLADIGYRGVSLADAVSQLRSTGAWPADQVALTFDDGYRNLWSDAHPVLRRLGFEATVYVVTGHVGTGNAWEAPPPGLGRQPTLSWDQLARMAAAGWEIGAHTRTHADLRALTAAEAEGEILGSCADIEGRLGQPVRTVAYPTGYHDPVATAIVERAGLAGCTTVLRRAGARDPIPALPRVDMYYMREPERLRALVTGRLDGYLAVRRWGRRVRAALVG